MSFLSWITGQIVIEEAGIGASDIESTVSRADVQITLVHEYVHFLQLVTSVGGIRLLADIIDLGVRGGLLLSGTITIPQVVDRRYEITPLLKGLDNFSWEQHPGIAERRNETMDELAVLVEPLAVPYTGQKDLWETDRQLVSRGSYTEPLSGFIVPSNGGPLFRPFSIGFLAENMARRVDRWFAQKVDPNHEWAGGELETYFYNGLLGILCRPQFDALRDAALEEIVVVVSALALATPRPDEATMLMLARLEQPIEGAPDIANIASVLRDVLVRRHLLHADHYNEAMWDVMRGVAQLMDREEYAGIHGRLVQVHHAANTLLDNPLTFVTPDLDWTGFRRWLSTFSPPPIVCESDGTTAAAIDGVSCSPFATEFLSEVERTLLAARKTSI